MRVCVCGCVHLWCVWVFVCGVCLTCVGCACEVWELHLCGAFGMCGVHVCVLCGVHLCVCAYV